MGDENSGDTAHYPRQMARYPTRRAVSAGGLVVDDRPDGRWVLLISRRSAVGALQWTLPKGGLEEGENRRDAALREVREETGLDCEIMAELGTIDYWFVWRPDEVRYHKFVHYYLMRHRGGEPSPRDDEAEDVEWMPLEEALSRLTHANERELVVAGLEAADAAGVGTAPLPPGGAA
jgi:8-oxo-dGTP pyrophosphatase MutT (NUDIX family)